MLEGQDMAFAFGNHRRDLAPENWRSTESSLDQMQIDSSRLRLGWRWDTFVPFAPYLNTAKDARTENSYVLDRRWISSGDPVGLSKKP